MIRSPLALALASSLACASHACASGAGAVTPWSIDSAGGGRAAREASYAGGAPGVLLVTATPAQLFIMWRRLHGLTVGVAQGEALAHPCCGASDQGAWRAEPAWLDARRAVPGAPALQAIQEDKPKPNGAFETNCQADAFRLATDTLKARIAAHGAASAAIRSWLAAQDAVFRACGEDVAALPAPTGGQPGWLARDRRYQQAALDLYDGRYDAAADGFQVIAEDPRSPWRPYAPYLIARSRMRRAFVSNTAADFAAAELAVDRLAHAPSTTVGRGDVASLRSAIAFREHPAERIHTLEDELEGAAPPSTAAADFKDLMLLTADQPERSAIVDWIVTLKARAAPAPGDETYDPQDRAAQPRRAARRSEAARSAARAHALARWTATRDPVWLLAALTLSDQREAGVGDLLRAADGAPAGAPPYLPLAWQRLRLELALHAPSTLRSELDAILRRSDLSPTSRNLFRAERLQVARTLPELRRFGLRERVCATPADDCVDVGEDDVAPWGVRDGAGDAGTVGFGEDARFLIDRMSLGRRIALAQDAQLAPRLRLDLLLTDWTRAVLLQRDADVLRLTREVAPLLPPLAADWRALLGSKPGPQRRFAEEFILAKVPGLDTDLATYVRPEGRNVADFQGGWPDWRFIAPGRPDANSQPPDALAYQPRPPYTGGDPALRRELASRADGVCFHFCGASDFPLRVPEAMRADAMQAARERGYFGDHAPSGAYVRGVYYRGWYGDAAPAPTAPRAGSTSAWEELFAYAEAHPREPRSAEALHWLVHIGRYGQPHDRIGERAFELLHRRYPKSAWARRDTSYRT